MKKWDLGKLHCMICGNPVEKNHSQVLGIDLCSNKCLEDFNSEKNLWIEIANEVMFLLSKENETKILDINFEISVDRVAIELANLVSYLQKYPLYQTFSMDQLKEGMKDDHFYVFNRSYSVFVASITELQIHNLVDAAFNKETGTIEFVTPKQTFDTMMTLSDIDQEACGGINSVDKYEILKKQILTTGKCPFCKRKMLVRDILLARLDNKIRGGISFHDLKANTFVAYHQLDKTFPEKRNKIKKISDEKSKFNA